MSLREIHNLHFLIFIFIISTNILLITSSDNLCPFKDIGEMLQYYAKGINPSTINNELYKWEYIYCVNGYHNSIYLLRDTNDPHFNEHAGIFIGSSINIAKLEESTIKNLTLDGIDEKDRDILKNLSHYIGEEAIKHYKKIENETYFSPEKVKSINKQVYDMYREKMKHDFQLDDFNNKPYSVHGFSFDLNLLTFYVKYYKMDDYLNKAKDFILGKKNTIDYMLLSYYFLNLKSDNTNQKKLWSRIALSSDRNYYKNKKYIGIYYDTSLKVEYEKNFTNFLSEFLRQFKKKHGINYYYFRLGNKSHIIDDREREQSEFAQNITNYNYTSNSTDIENITEGISKFEKVFNTPIKEINKYYQNHLIIFVNNISNVNGIINTDIFTNNGIQVILFVKITDKNDLNLIKAKFNDKFNVITFHEYKNLNDYIYILKNAIIFNVQNFYYTNKIQLKNINTDTSSDRDSDDTYRKNILYNLKITFNEKLLSNNRAEDYNYFHIQLIYDGNNKVYNNNINMTFLVSQENPFPDITNYDIPNFCLNNSVPKENNPYINYSLKKYNTSNYFYISIMANDVGYSLQITLKNTSSDIDDSNGRFGNISVSIMEGKLIATYSENLVYRKCPVDNITLFKYFSTGVHYSDKDKTLKKIIDLNMMACLYNNVLGPYFEVSKGDQEILTKHGPYIGYAIDLSTEESFNLYWNGVPLYLINKLHPFLINSINKTGDEPKKIVTNYNLKLTLQENYLLNHFHFIHIMTLLENDYNKKFTNLDDTQKLCIFLRVLERNVTDDHIKINEDIDDLKNKKIDNYLQKLFKTPPGFVTTNETLNFQLMLAQTEKYANPKKCLVSIVIAKGLLWSNAFMNVLKSLEIYRISLTVFDLDTGQAMTLVDFEEDWDTINNIITDIKEYDSFQRPETVDIDAVLNQQKTIFEYYDKGIKKCIVIISTNNAVIYRNNFKKPSINLLEDLYNEGILIFDYSDQASFIEESNSDISFYDSTRYPFVQYVPFFDYLEMNKDVQTLINAINRFPIPITNIININLDLELGEEIHYEFNFTKEIKKLKDKDYFNQYNILYFTFDTPGLNVYFSRDYIYPNNYSNEASYSIDESGKQIKYDLKKLTNSIFYMTISSPNKVDNSIINIDICDDDGNCFIKGFKLKFYISFIVIGIGILAYGIYICFCETNFKKESNIFERK